MSGISPEKLLVSSEKETVLFQKHFSVAESDEHRQADHDNEKRRSLTSNIYFNELSTVRLQSPMF